MNRLKYGLAVEVLAALTLVLWTSVSVAGIVRVQDDTLAILGKAEDGFNVTRDTVNRLEWLDWTLTTGFSIQVAETWLLPEGGPLQGWRLATALEFSGLGTAAGVPLPYLDNMVTGAAPVQLADLALALGFTRDADQSAFAAFGETGTGGAGTVRLGGLSLAAMIAFGRSATVAVFDIPNEPQLWLSQNWPETMAHSTVALALVRPVATVSAPLSGALLTVGLLGLGVASRRRGTSVRPHASDSSH